MDFHIFFIYVWGGLEIYRSRLGFLFFVSRETVNSIWYIGVSRETSIYHIEFIIIMFLLLLPIYHIGYFVYMECFYI